MTKKITTSFSTVYNTRVQYSLVQLRFYTFLYYPSLKIDYHGCKLFLNPAVWYLFELKNLIFQDSNVGKENVVINVDGKFEMITNYGDLISMMLTIRTICNVFLQ